MKNLAAIIAFFIISANILADAACIKSIEAGYDHSKIVDIRVGKITETEYIANIKGPNSLSDINIHSVTVYRGTKGKHTLAIPLEFQIDSDSFTAWFVGHPDELQGLTTYISYSGNGKCSVDIAQPLRITKS